MLYSSLTIARVERVFIVVVFVRSPRFVFSFPVVCVCVCVSPRGRSSATLVVPPTSSRTVRTIAATLFLACALVVHSFTTSRASSPSYVRPIARDSASRVRVETRARDGAATSVGRHARAAVERERRRRDIDRDIRVDIRRYTTRGEGGGKGRRDSCLVVTRAVVRSSLVFGRHSSSTTDARRRRARAREDQRTDGRTRASTSRATSGDGRTRATNGRTRATTIDGRRTTTSGGTREALDVKATTTRTNEG